MTKKLMVFGGSGFVGGNLLQVAQHRHWKVCNADNHPGLPVEWQMINITDKNSVETAIEAVTPDAVVNVAAIADIDQAERDKELAYKVNVDGARYIAESCARRHIRYVFFSSDAVFDGEGRSYTEEDAPHPTNYYGLTKMEAEKAVLQLHNSAAIIRISLVLGFPVTGGNSFFANLENKLKEGKEISAPTYEIRTPIDVFTLCECVLELCDSKYSGVIHLGATDSISRYELTRKLSRQMGFNEALVKPQNTPEIIPGRAPRHKNGIIGVTKAQGILTTKLLSTDKSIQRALNKRP
jgi:dTDP-4-dehydrorhamnose reductase